MKLKKEFAIGFWTIVALATLFFGINWLKGVHTLHEGSIYYLVCDKVDGLAVSSNVKLHGLKVGIVRDMEYDEQSDRIVVTLNIYDNSLRIPRDSRLFVQGDLLGTSDIILISGQKKDYYNSNDTIYAPNAAPGLLEKADPLIAKVDSLLPKIDSLVSGINVLVRESKMQETLLELNKMSTHLNQSVNQLNRLLNKEIPGILANVEQTTANLDTISVQIKEADIKELLANANKTIVQTNNLIEKVQSDQGTMGQLINNSQLHDQLNQTIADVDALINDIKANPKKYIRIKVF